MRLGHKLGLTLLTLTFLVLGLGFFASFLAERSVRASVEASRCERVGLSASDIGHTIEAELANTFAIAEAPGLILALVDMKNVGNALDETQTSVRQQLQQLQQAVSPASVPLFAASDDTLGLGLYSSEGVLIAQIGKAPKVPNLREAHLEAAREKGLAFGPAHFRGEDLVLPTIVSMKDANGKVVGMLRSEISLSFGFSMLSSRLHNTLQANSIHLTLVNRDGGAICRIDTDAAPTAERLTANTLARNKHKATTIFRRDRHSDRRLVTSFASPRVMDSSAIPFYLVFDEAYESAMLPAHGMRITIITTACILLALAYIACACMSAEFRGRADSLNQAILQLQNREYGAEVAADGHDDLDQLARSVNSLSRAISVNKEGTDQSREAFEAVQAKLELQTQRLANQTEKISALEQQIEKADHSRNFFLTAMSYEIRTPLNSILGYIELLKGSVDKEDKRSSGFIKEMSTSGQHLLMTIDDILDLSAIDGDRMATRAASVELLPLLQEVTSRFRHRADQKNLAFTTTFEGDIPKSISTDASRLRQVLLNLVGNAINYTRKGSVDIHVRCSNGELSQLEIDIRDSGPGITSERLEALFDPASRADGNKVQRVDWSGFGLGVSKKLAQSLGGDITVSSTEGVGSCFTLTVSAGDTTNAKILESPSELWQHLTSDVKERRGEDSSDKEGPLNCRILLAEDSPDNQRLMALFLKRMGADVTVVENGELAVEALLNQGDAVPFSVVLLDMQMPVLDGYSAAWQLRSLGRTEPIVAVTAHALPGEREKCLVAGCTDYIAKPINHREFEEVVRKWAKASTEEVMAAAIRT